MTEPELKERVLAAMRKHRPEDVTKIDKLMASLAPVLITDEQRQRFVTQFETNLKP